MSQRVEPAPVLRLCSCLTSDPELLPKVEAELVHTFGDIALKSSAFLFDTSDYYQDELGRNLKRYWFCFRDLCGAERLPETRHTTGQIEDLFVEEGKRRINLDPGYLDFAKLVLASLKEAPDKIYLGDGVWAHTCLRYGHGDFKAPNHSFPDFQDGRFNNFFLEARNLYKVLLQKIRQNMNLKTQLD